MDMKIPGRKTLVEANGKRYLILTDSRYQKALGYCIACSVEEFGQENVTKVKVNVNDTSFFIDVARVELIDLADEVVVQGQISDIEFRKVLQILIPILGGELLFTDSI
ncbi:TPA: hypothetical protein JG825_003510 [Vibrio parahaemolyticus]|uniref:hypothetical protein n=1 Tax=Vibrio harveyi group TaxID=717610 RepID=UPI00206FBF4B|nr:MULTISPECIES: hypothetical protein [Vibrio harveyi group]MCR9909724.1 hypothetical protein [Vibrio campbellii]UPR19028.1 hypothetical protein H9J99_26130 [Vibrio parahaemolyticus]WJT11057.1 hypothetical protein PH545_28355 [Vibrio harveyi]HAV1520191.1 hypothetical protein [Vibrio parahaemolyticus]HAV1539157.1 hypothetical protein [Vibrio parahaemolyticus]